MSTPRQPSHSYSGWGSYNTLSRTLARRSPFANRSIPQATLQAHAQAHAAAAAAATSEEPSHQQQTLFGPIIGGEDGVEDGGMFDDPSAAKSESVGVDVVKGWIEKSKSEQAPHPTTTLQSLVNLKRPTLLLQPIHPMSPTASHSSHLLKFTYDTSTPTTLLTLTLYVHSPTLSNPLNINQQVIHHANLPGGFGQTFQLQTEDAVDLTEVKKLADAAWERYDRAIKTEEAEKEKESASKSVEEVDGGSAITESQAKPAGKFSFFGRSGRVERERDVEAQLEVPMSTLGVNETNAGEPKGVVPRREMRIVVRLEARGEKGEPIPSLNAQRTHVELVLQPGTHTSDSIASPHTAEPGQPGPASDHLEEVDLSSVPLGLEETGGLRGGHWVAKVVKREALIGSHTFQLREIYGLTNTVSAQEAESSTYPPQQPEDPTLNDCIVCLVSPKDVVLLPCRHLVVCKECAVGMIEFGAGGKVLRREEPIEGAPEDGTAVGAEGGPSDGTTAVQPSDTVLTPAQERRRKKKAKGWFCPVCRQPYTSLLRIALPASKPGFERTHSHSHTGEDPIVRAPSPTPTLPRRAASVLYPEADERRFFEDDHDDESERGTDEAVPTFVLGEEEEGGQVERRRAEVTV